MVDDYDVYGRIETKRTLCICVQYWIEKVAEEISTNLNLMLLL